MDFASKSTSNQIARTKEHMVWKIREHCLTSMTSLDVERSTRKLLDVMPEDWFNMHSFILRINTASGGCYLDGTPKASTNSVYIVPFQPYPRDDHNSHVLMIHNEPEKSSWVPDPYKSNDSHPRYPRLIITNDQVMLRYDDDIKLATMSVNRLRGIDGELRVELQRYLAECYLLDF